MKKADLLTAVAAKAGYVAIIADDKTADSPRTGTKEKRYFDIETLNGDGTVSVYKVTYWYDTATDDAWYYNTEPFAFDMEVKSVPQQTLDALHTYCKATFAAYFLIPDRIDATNKWAVVEAYTLSAGKLAKGLKMVYKQGTSPITHVDIV